MHDNALKKTLAKAGWTITSEPFVLTFGDVESIVDFAAEQGQFRQMSPRKIAVESARFSRPFEIEELSYALGSFMVNEAILERLEPDRSLALAIDQDAARDIFEDPLGRLVFRDERLRVLVWDPAAESIVDWLPRRMFDDLSPR
jgi:hypothetical protein